MRNICLFLAFLVPLAVTPAYAAPARVLFLGGVDNQPAHDPKALWDTLAPVFAANGMAASYRDTQTVLHPDSLNQYDVAFLYTADHGSGTAGGANLTTAQEDALIAWVERGHVIVAFHGSTNTYLNNPRWVNLLGAVYQDHGPVNNSGTITFTQPGHPALVGAVTLPASAASTGGAPYWDEGRRHKNYVPDTVVLARTQSGATIPWIWVRPQGNGWVYYNSSGHDGQTWTRPEWKGQVIEALKWGAGIAATGLRAGERAGGARPLDQRPFVLQNALILPASGGPFELVIRTVSGKKVQRIARIQGSPHNLSGLALGAYTLHLRGADGLRVRIPFMKAH